MSKRIEIMKPGLGLGGATFDVAAVGEALHSGLGHDVHLTAGTIDEASRRFLASRALLDVTIIPELDRFHPDHSVERLDSIVRAHDQETVMFNQAFQSGPFALAALRRALRVEPRRSVLMVPNDFPTSQFEMLEAMPQGVKCWVVNPGYIPFLSQYNDGLDYGTLPSPLDVKRFRPESTEQTAAIRAQVRSRHGVTDEDIMLFQPTRVHPQKDLKLSVDFACELQVKSGRTVRLVVAGGNEVLEDSRRFQTEVEAYAQAKGYTSLVLVGGIADANGRGNRMSDYFWAADAAIMPSAIDAAPNTLGEAAYCGLPIVTTKFGDAFLEDTFTPLYGQFDTTLISRDEPLAPKAEALLTLFDTPNLLATSIEHNHQLSKAFSVETLPDLLRILMA
ncbi:MAG TPA: glycosyltransferase [Candidatus Chromulinivoraceae bacterium]|nr:glycosyltransferase [Candidatus Chromulinivoraceae bacterium]